MLPLPRFARSPARPLGKIPAAPADSARPAS